MFIFGQTAQENTEAYTQQQLKSVHLRQIFDAVLDEKRTSRRMLADDMNLSPTAVSSLVDELLEEGVLITVGQGESKRAGRKPIMLEINRQWRQIVTFQAAPDFIEYALFDMGCEMLESAREPIQGNEYISAMQSVLSRSRFLEMEQVIAVCLAVPAIADAGNQRLLLNVLDLEDDGTPFLEQVQAMFSSSVLLVGNDSAAFAYAEKEFGSKEEVEDLIYVNYTHGIGAGIIVDGTIFNDDKYKTGEIGHMSIDMNGPQCICGSRGCLERVASIPALIRSARQQIEDGGYSALTDLCGGDLAQIDIDMMIQAYRDGDRLVEQVFEDLAYKLSFGIHNVLSMFHPREIVIGGVAHRFGDAFLEMLRANARGTFFWDRIYETAIRYTRVQEFGANLGLAKYYLDQVLSFE